MNPLTFFATHKTGSSALGGLITGAVAAEVVAPTVVTATDYTGMAALVGVVGVLIVNIMNARTARKAQEVKDAIAAEDRKEVRAALVEAKSAAEAAKVTSEATGHAVDGSLHEMKLLIAKNAKAEGKAEEQAAQRDRALAVADALAAEKPAAPAAAAAPAIGPVPVEVVNPPNKALNVTDQGNQK